MGHDRTHRDTLTKDEIAEVRAIVEKHGLKEASALLGLHAEATLAKALAGLPVHSLTATTVRARLFAQR